MRSLLRSFGHRASKNSPTILLIAGLFGVGVTVTMAVKATPKALALLDEKKNEKFESMEEEQKTEVVKSGEDIKLTVPEIIQTTWKVYWPTAAVGVGSCLCFIFSHRISARRQLALAAAYELSKNTLNNYQQQVIENVGERKEREIREESYKNDDIFNEFDERDVINTGHGNYLFFDYLSGRYFRSDIEYVRKVVNDINMQLRHEFWVSANDFYYGMDMGQIGFGKDLGWRLEDGDVEFDFSYGPGPKSNGDSCCIMTPSMSHYPNYKFGDLSR